MLYEVITFLVEVKQDSDQLGFGVCMDGPIRRLTLPANGAHNSRIAKVHTELVCNPVAELGTVYRLPQLGEPRTALTRLNRKRAGPGKLRVVVVDGLQSYNFV